MGFPFALAGISAGATALKTFFEQRSQEERLRKLREQMLRDLELGEGAALAGRMSGLSTNESSAVGQASQRTMQLLAGSGIGRSSVTPNAVAASIAPFLIEHERDILNRTERLGAIRREIFGATTPTGPSPFASAFGGFMGDVGDVAGFQAGKGIGFDDILDLLDRLGRGRG